MKNRFPIFILVVFYAILFYFLNEFYLIDYDKQNLFINKVLGDSVNKKITTIYQIYVGDYKVLSILVYLRFHLFLICLAIQIIITNFINKNPNSTLLLIIVLVFIFFMKNYFFYLSNSESKMVKWYGYNIYSRLLLIHDLLFSFPTLPFLIYIFNLNLNKNNKFLRKS
jgi:hypothetical protein